jgi:hypothetical protein
VVCQLWPLVASLGLNNQRIATKKKIVPRIAKKKIILPRIATVKSLNLRADCQELFLLWQTAVHLRALCQGTITVVAKHDIGARFATTDWNPAPVLYMYQQFYIDNPPVWRIIYFRRASWQVKNLHAADCLGLNYASVVSVCHTVSWHCTFKNKNKCRIHTYGNFCRVTALFHGADCLPVIIIPVL